MQTEQALRGGGSHQRHVRPTCQTSPVSTTAFWGTTTGAQLAKKASTDSGSSSGSKSLKEAWSLSGHWGSGVVMGWGRCPTAGRGAGRSAGRGYHLHLPAPPPRPAASPSCSCCSLRTSPRLAPPRGLCAAPGHADASVRFCCCASFPGGGRRRRSEAPPALHSRVSLPLSEAPAPPVFSFLLLSFLWKLHSLMQPHASTPSFHPLL